MWRRRETWEPGDVLAQQLAMNRESWAALQEHGVTPDTELRLDFFYAADAAGDAEQLASFLAAETDYDLETTATAVTGTTQATTVDLDVLDQWVRWMVAAGVRHGRCRFDGWGAELPAASG